MATVLSENSKIPQRCLVLLVRSRRAIRTYLREYVINLRQEADNIPYEEVDPATYDSVVMDTDAADQKKKNLPMLILGGSWGRLIFSPVSRGRQVTIDVFRSTKQDGSEDLFEHVV